MVWKLLVGDEPALEDLAAADVSMAHVVTSVKEAGKLAATGQEFSDVFGDLRMVYHDSLGQEASRSHGTPRTHKENKGAADPGRRGCAGAPPCF